MNKKLVLVCCVVMVFCFAGFLTSGWAQKAEATTVSDINMFKGINILGIGVVPAGGAKFNIIDMDTEELASTSATLPALSGNNGMVVVYKTRNFNEGGTAYIHPAAGDSMEGGRMAEWPMMGYGPYVSLIADTANDTWWMIGSGGSW